MVALFGLAGKGSPSRSPRNQDPAPAAVPPPPPYSQDNPDPALLAATTTTTTTHIVTTTQTTTHFFSLPLWRRRGTPAYSPAVAPKGPASLSTDELGVISAPHDRALTHASVLLRDKELPPTPSLSPENLTPPSRLSPDPPQADDGDDTTRTIRRNDSSRSAGLSDSSSRASSVQPATARSSYAPGDSSSPAQPTLALARAALGIGLPLGAPSVSASTSSSEVNSVMFLQPHAPSTSELRRPNPTIRHAKSFQKEREASPVDSPATARDRRRARGLSLGPLALMSSDNKGKQRETDVDLDAAEPRPISRKSSFWSRRRVNSRPDTAPAPSSLRVCEDLRSRSECRRCSSGGGTGGTKPGEGTGVLT